ncbi:unnamed protein product [Ixodes pacificus]
MGDRDIHTLNIASDSSHYHLSDRSRCCGYAQYARDMCQSLGVRGWIKLTNWGTVVGQLQGEKEHVDQMAMWLRLQGAPGSRIERCDFKHWRMIESYDFSCFQMRF